MLRICAPTPPYDNRQLQVRPLRSATARLSFHCRTRLTSATAATWAWRPTPQAIFEAIAGELPALSRKDDPVAFDRAFQIVASLATVRSCCILAELAGDTAVADADKPEALVNQVIATLFDSLT